MIKCEICQLLFEKSIEKHVQVEHGLSKKDYKLQYPNCNLRLAWNKGLNKLTDNRVLKLSKKSTENHWSKDTEKSNEIKNKISLKNSGKKRTLDFINNLKQKTGEKNNNFNKKWTLAKKQKASDEKKDFYIKNPEIKNKIKKNHWSTNLELKEKIINNHKELMAKLISSGQIDIINGFKTGWYYSKKMNEKFYYMSSYEFLRMEFLENKEEVISYTKNHNIILDYYSENGSIKKYIPDFLIVLKNNTTILEEVKGYINNKKDFKEKCISANQYCIMHNYTFQIIYKNNLTELMSQINTYE